MSIHLSGSLLHLTDILACWHHLIGKKPHSSLSPWWPMLALVDGTWNCITKSVWTLILRSSAFPDIFLFILVLFIKTGQTRTTFCQCCQRMLRIAVTQLQLKHKHNLTLILKRSMWKRGSFCIQMTGSRLQQLSGWYRQIRWVHYDTFLTVTINPIQL